MPSPKQDATPLPWRVFESTPGNPHRHPGIDSTSDDGDFSIVCYGHEDEDTGVQGRTPEESHANAHLIVTAVNSHELLVAACKAVRPIVVAQAEAEHMLDGFGPRTQRPTDDILAALDAALDAAKEVAGG